MAIGKVICGASAQLAISLKHLPTTLLTWWPQGQPHPQYQWQEANHRRGRRTEHGSSSSKPATISPRELLTRPWMSLQVVASFDMRIGALELELLPYHRLLSGHLHLLWRGDLHLC